MKASTAFGEAVYVIGSVPELGLWATSSALALSADGYTESNPVWKGNVELSVGQDVQYKFVKLLSDGTFVWEADPNRQLTVPSDCTATTQQVATWQA